MTKCRHTIQIAQDLLRSADSNYADERAIERMKATLEKVEPLCHASGCLEVQSLTFPRQLCWKVVNLPSMHALFVVSSEMLSISIHHPDPTHIHSIKLTLLSRYQRCTCNLFWIHVLRVSTNCPNYDQYSGSEPVIWTLRPADSGSIQLESGILWWWERTIFDSVSADVQQMFQCS